MNKLLITILLILSAGNLYGFLDEYKKATNIYEIPANKLLENFNSNSEYKKIKDFLKTTTIIKQDNNSFYSYNDITKINKTDFIKSKVFLDNEILLATSSSEYGYVFYLDNNYKFKKVLIIKNTINTPKLLISPNGQYLFDNYGDDQLLNLINFETLKIDIPKNFFTDFSTFSTSSKYLYLYGRYVMNSGDLINPTQFKFDIKNKNMIYSKPQKSNLSFANLKYMNDNTTSNNKNYTIEEQDGSIFLQNKEGEKVYTFIKKDDFSYFRSFDMSMKDGNAFILYSYKDTKDKTHWDIGGIYNTKLQKLVCKDYFKVDKDVVGIGWIDYNKAFVIDIKNIYYYAFEEDECIKVGQHAHIIKNLEKIYKTDIKNNTMTIHSKQKEKFAINKLELRNIDQDTINIYKSFKKINKMLNAGFEKRALKQIDNLIQKHYNKLQSYHYSNIDVEKNTDSYQAYFLAKQLLKKIENGVSFKNSDIYSLYFSYSFETIINGFPQAAYELTKHLKKNMKKEKSLEESTKRKYNDLFTLIEAVYLISIEKEEGYDLLFDLQPLSKKLKTSIYDLTNYQNSFSINKKKLMVALDLKEDEFGKNKKIDMNKFSFDMYGNKIYKDKTKNTLPQQKEKQIKKEKIELLD